jgi:hypothetical protein
MLDKSFVFRVASYIARTAAFWELGLAGRIEATLVDGTNCDFATRFP